MCGAAARKISQRMRVQQLYNESERLDFYRLLKPLGQQRTCSPFWSSLAQFSYLEDVIVNVGTIMFKLYAKAASRDLVP